MSERTPPDGEQTIARIAGVLYLTFAAAVGGGWPLYWHPASVYLRCGRGVAAVAGCGLSVVLVRFTDPTRRPGLLWLTLGCAVGPAPSTCSPG